MKIGNKALGRGLVLFLALVLLLSFAASNLFAAPGLPNPGSDSAFANEKVNVLVGFYGPPAKEVVKNVGGEIYAEFTIVNVIAASMTSQAADALERNPRVAYVELDGLMYAVETVTAQSDQTVPWGINRVFGSAEYRISTWEQSKGNGIGVAVLDTGIDGTHLDLPALSGGENTVDDTDFHSDVRGHGTHVAGTIAAIDNDFGVVGVAPGAKLYAVKVLDDNGSGSDSTVMKGIEWAVENKISVINMSLGGGYSQSLQAACNAAYKLGHLLIASAGNSGNPGGGGNNVGYPAGYDSVIAVAASDINNRRASFSSTGPAVELIAPGVSIKSTVPGGYATYNGTSMAAPHVSGVAALVWAADPEMTSSELRAVLRDTAEDLGLAFNHQGYGMVRADLAVSEVGEAEPPTPTDKYDLSISSAAGGSVTDPGEGPFNYEEGTVVDLLAVAESGYKFVSWTGDTGTIADVNASSTTITMNSNYSITATFAVFTVEGMVRVESIEYSTSGGRFNDRHLDITLLLMDDQGNMVSNASVSATLKRDGSFWSYQGTTGSEGTVTFSLNNHVSGSYETEVTAVSAEGLEWDGETPTNSYSK